MNPNRFWRPAAAVVIFGACMGAAQAVTSPPIQITQGIEYMCGGRTGEEAAFMKTVSPRWAATLEFGISRSASGARFPSEVKVVVRERYTGREVMQALTGAPFMLARLNPGAYEIEATMAGITLTEPMVVFSGAGSKAVFTWPSNVDFAAAMGSTRPEHQASVSTGD
jgi:hypothetical protein